MVHIINDYGTGKRVRYCGKCYKLPCECPSTKPQLRVSAYKEALERLAIPIAFGAPKMAGPEEQARMVYAQAILDGRSLTQAEEMAIERAREASRHYMEAK